MTKPKFVDDLAEQEFEIQTFKVESCLQHARITPQGKSRSGRPQEFGEQVDGEEDKMKSQDRSSVNNSQCLSNSKQSINSSSSSNDSNRCQAQ